MMRILSCIIIASLTLSGCLNIGNSAHGSEIIPSDNLEKKYLYNYFLESLKWNNTVKENIVGSHEGVTKDLKSMLNGNRKLVVEYSPLSCTLCVDSLFNYLGSSKLNKDLIIITGSKNKNLVKIELDKYNIQGAVLMRDLSLDIVNDKNTNPRIYYLEPSMNIQHYISIDKMMVKYLKDYIYVLERLISG